MREYLLILKGDGMKDMSPNDLQSMFAQYQEWVTDLGAQYLGGQRLEENGAYLVSKEGAVATDGPFLESKEIIAGYFLVQAEDLDDAIAITKTVPHLGPYGIEVRPLVWPKM
ncbi:MAG: hypothetical protein COA58_09515 [Bacteroidetes bacterium]|nr:MAG: hypothetical protein COA58_09515 [Bacteroidota bacterium]